MPYALDLRGSLAKIDRAKKHIDALRRAIKEVAPKGEFVSLRRQFEPEQRAIVYRIERIIEIPEDWSLIIGDAVHNLRCALDHLAWQLAIRHFNGLEPADRRIIKQIQFPVVIQKDQWVAHINRKHMSVADAENLKEFQPFNLGPNSRAQGKLHPLEMLAGFSGLSNIDKHRSIQVTYTVLHEGRFTNDGRYIDCTPLLNKDGLGQWILTPPSATPKPGDEILRVLVVPMGPNPDVDFKASIAGYVAIREKWDAIHCLDAIANIVETILRKFS